MNYKENLVKYIKRFYKPVVYTFTLLSIAVSLQAAQFEPEEIQEPKPPHHEILYGVEVQLPTKAILEKRLRGFSDLLQHSNLLAIADKTKWASEIPVRVQTSIEEYANAGGEPMRISILRKHGKKRITELILSDYPEAIKKLEKQGLI